MINTSRTYLFLTTNLTLLSFLFLSLLLSLLLSCSSSTSSDPSSSNNSEPTPITGTFTYNALNVIAGGTSTATPTWEGALANQTVTYTIARKSEVSIPTSITIDSSTGVVSVAISAVAADNGTYIVTATGTGNYTGSTTATITVTLIGGIQGTFTYSPLDIEAGTVGSATPIWTGNSPAQTVTYTMVKQGGTQPASITIDSSTGVVNLAASTVVADGGTYTITANRSGQYSGTKQTTLTITIRSAGVTLTPIQGTLTYSPLNIVAGTASTVTTVNPSWTGDLATQTVTYGIARKDGASLPVNITIDSSAGIVSLATSAVAADSGTYTITASGNGQYNDSRTADIVITITENIQGTFTYSLLDIEKGSTTNSTPSWTGALAAQTVTYTMVKQGGGNLPASITISSSTGIISVATSAVVADSDTYTITASGTGAYGGAKQTTLTITIRPVGATLTTIQGTLTYTALNAVSGTASTATPTWTGALANQTVTYTIARKDGSSLSGNITIDSTGVVSVATSAGFQDGGTYTITATGTGNYQGSITSDILITITIVINTAVELQAITNNIVILDSLVYNTAGTNATGATGQHIAGNYQLGGDIDLSGMTGFTPIGSRAIPFIGAFDGKGYTVTLAINTTKPNIGLFGVVGIDESHTDDTAALSKIHGAITIRSIGVSGTVAGDNNLGGLVGRLNGGTIQGHSEVTIMPTGSLGENFGGLVAIQRGGTIIGYSTSNVSGNFKVGGLVGTQTGGTIIGYVTGNVSGNIQVGGLVGSQEGGITIGYATGNISAVSSILPLRSIGGLLGSQTGGTVTGYATGAVTGTATDIQGFIGEKTGGSIQGGYFDAASTGRTDTAATSISAAANIYKFAGSTETSGRTVGKFYDKATGTSATAEDSGDTEIFTAQEFIDAFDLANTPNGRFPKLKAALFGTLPQP